MPARPKWLDYRSSVTDFIESCAREYTVVCQKVGIELPEHTIFNVGSTGGKAKVRVSGPLNSFWGFDVRKIIDDLDAIENLTEITMTIETPGGLVSDGLTLYHYMRRRAGEDKVAITTEAGGIVASAGTFPYLAGQKRLSSESSQFMVHEPIAAAIFMGNSEDILKMAKRITSALDTTAGTIRNIYNARIDASEKTINKWLSEETWFDSKAANEAGISTEIVSYEDPEETETENKIKAMAAKLFGQAVMNRTENMHYAC